MAEENEKTVELPPPPQQPAASECCGRGCEPCVFDYYELALQRWRELRAEQDRKK